MSTARNQYKFPRWFVEALKVYFLEARPVFLKKHPNQREQSMAMKFQRLDPSGVEKRPIRTELLFDNSTGNHNFRAKHVSDQFMEQVQKKRESRVCVLKMKVAELIPLTCSPEVRLPNSNNRHPKYTRLSMATSTKK